MRIAYLTQVDLSRGTGAVRHVAGIARALAARGHDVQVYAPSADAIDLGHALAVPLNRASLSPLSEIESLARVASAATKPDVVIVRLATTPGIAAAASRIVRAPLVVEVNGPPDDELAQRGAPLSRVVLSRTLARLVLRSADRIVAVTHGLAASIADRYAIPRDRIAVVPNGVDTAALVPGDQTEARRRLGLSADRPIVGVAGTLMEHHDGTTLVAAVARLAGRAELVVAGDGPDRARMEGAARDAGVQARFLGPVPHATAADVIRAADVAAAFFRSARALAIGLSPIRVWEALALGRRLVATRCPGIDALEGARLEGVSLARPEDPEDAARALAAQLDLAAGRRGDVDLALRAFAEGHADWSASAAALEEVLQAILRERGR